jgi:BMFP domain-containing protein YqiC
MNITNHVYSYSIYVQETSSYAKIIKKFDSILEINRIKIEEEIQQNIKHSLQTILNSLD